MSDFLFNKQAKGVPLNKRENTNEYICVCELEINYLLPHLAMVFITIEKSPRQFITLPFMSNNVVQVILLL